MSDHKYILLQCSDIR